MMSAPRGKYYLKDELVAKRMSIDEARRWAMLPEINEWQDKASFAEIDLLAAYEHKAPEHIIQTLINTKQIANDNLKMLEKKLARRSSYSEMFRQLDLAPGEAPAALAKPVKVFTAQEMESINAHYDKLPENLKKLMEAAILDDHVNYGFMAQPVFIRGEGQVYDRPDVITFLNGRSEALALVNKDVKYGVKDIIPCNPILIAMQHLLTIIQNKPIQPPAYQNELSHLIEGEAKVDKRVIELMKANYFALPAKHKILFDALCRDPITHKIMSDPVFLPDGYIYDRVTALDYLETLGTCPLNDKISFAKEDITPCVFVIKIIDQLKEMVDANVARQIEGQSASASLKR